METIKTDRIKHLRSKAALLVCPENPLLRSLGKLTTDELISAGLMDTNQNNAKRLGKRLCLEVAYGMSDTGINNWVRGEELSSPQRDTVNKICERASRVAQNLKVFEGNSNWELQPSHFYEQDKWDFGILFGFSWEYVQKYVDKYMWPMCLPNTWNYLDVRDARKLLRCYEGFYHVYHHSPSENRKVVVVRSAMRVRYSLKIKNGSYLVRCKLHMPKINYKPEENDDEEDAYYQYDGVLVSRDGKLYWYFDLYESRTVDPDQFTMITTDERDDYSSHNGYSYNMM